MNKNGKPGDIAFFVEVLSKAKEEVLHSDMIKKLIEHFYEENKNAILKFGFAPFATYFFSAVIYLSSDMILDKVSIIEKENLSTVSTIAFGMTILGIGYFSYVEIRQIKNK